MEKIDEVKLQQFLLAITNRFMNLCFRANFVQILTDTLKIFHFIF